MITNPCKSNWLDKHFSTNCLIFKYCTFFSLLFFSAGCNHSGARYKDPVEEFGGLQEYQIKGSPVALENDSVLYDPRTIRVFDSMAICCDNTGAAGFSAINLNSGKLITRFAVAGNGTDEFNLLAVSLNPTMHARREITLLQSNPPKRLFVYNLDSLIANKQYKPDYTVQFPKDIRYFEKAIMLNDSVILGKLNLKNDRNFFGLYDMNSNSLNTGLGIGNEAEPQKDDSVSSLFLNSMMGGNMEFRPDDSHEIAYFSSKGAYENIFRIDSLLHFNVISEKLFSLPAFEILNQGHNTYSTRMSKECRNGYNSIAVTKDRIYALYNGKSATSGDVKDLSASTVLVYDWLGKPVERITLDLDCYCISIDPNKPKVLYALNSFGKIGITKYDLP
jgi:TolB-like 6-blade propeller-like